MKIKMLVEITGGIVSCVRMTSADVEVEVEVWDWDCIDSANRDEEARAALTEVISQGQWEPAPFDDCEFLREVR
jgi:hypothetical protein